MHFDMPQFGQLIGYIQNCIHLSSLRLERGATLHPTRGQVRQPQTGMAGMSAQCVSVQLQITSWEEALWRNVLTFLSPFSTNYISLTTSAQH